jgi:hypothetical protein
VSSPIRVVNDLARAQRVLDLVPSVPTPVWGRDELHTGEMWNSNSLTSWLLARAELPYPGLVDADGRDAPRRAGRRVAGSDRRYFSLGSMTKVDALEGGEDPRELLAQIA